jgi:hypothetical protein
MQGEKLLLVEIYKSHHSEWQVMDKHLDILAKKHIETKFVKASQ